MTDRNQYLTTGEAAKILGISASTIIRRFDKGELEGTCHPITGRRLILRESLNQFINEHNLPAENLARTEVETPPQKRLLVADPVRADIERLRELFAEDARVEFDSECEGSRVPGAIIRQARDLLLLNTEFEDIGGLDVLHVIDHLPDLESMRIVLTNPAGKKIRDEVLAGLGVSGYLPKPWSVPEIRTQILALLGLTGGHETIIPQTGETNRRRFPRINTDWPAEISIYETDSTARFDTGSARIANISLGGAALRGLQLERGALPARPFTFNVHVTGGEAEGVAARCRPVRIDTRGGLGLRGQFLDLNREHYDRLEKTINQ